MNTIREQLQILIGRWKVEISAMSFRFDKTETVRGLTTFRWMDGLPFIIQRSEYSDPGFPSETEIIGTDDSHSYCNVLYADDRGIRRNYFMSLEDTVWKEWRSAPGFSQRFTGTFDDSRSIITGKWESAEDGIKWVHDFNVVYTRI